MIYSLRWQFLLSMVIVVLITVGMTAFFANSAATAEFNRVQNRDSTDRNLLLAGILGDEYSKQQSWWDAQSLLKHAELLFGQRVLLIDDSAAVAADSQGDLLGQQLDPDPDSHKTFPVFGPEGQLGTLLIETEPTSGPRLASQPLSDPSGPSLSLLLILSGLLAVAVSMVLTFFLSHRIVAPVESLARVAQAT